MTCRWYASRNRARLPRPAAQPVGYATSTWSGWRARCARGRIPTPGSQRARCGMRFMRRRLWSMRARLCERCAGSLGSAARAAGGARGDSQHRHALAAVPRVGGAVGGRGAPVGHGASACAVPGSEPWPMLRLQAEESEPPKEETRLRHRVLDLRWEPSDRLRGPCGADSGCACVGCTPSWQPKWQLSLVLLHMTPRRRPRMAANLRLRHKLLQCVRRYLEVRWVGATRPGGGREPIGPRLSWVPKSFPQPTSRASAV
jgi:hypothetical protein